MTNDRPPTRAKLYLVAHRCPQGRHCVSYMWFGVPHTSIAIERFISAHDHVGGNVLSYTVFDTGEELAVEQISARTLEICQAPPWTFPMGNGVVSLEQARADA